jgi:hypothetical protein
MTFYFWNRIFSLEIRNGIGIDLEFCDSRPVWTVKDGEHDVMPFEGVVIQLPFLTLSIGNVYQES